MAYREIKMWLVSCDQPGCGCEERMESSEPSAPYAWEVNDDGSLVCHRCIFAREMKASVDDLLDLFYGAKE